MVEAEEAPAGAEGPPIRGQQGVSAPAHLFPFGRLRLQPRLGVRIGQKENRNNSRRQRCGTAPNTRPRRQQSQLGTGTSGGRCDALRKSRRESAPRRTRPRHHRPRHRPQGLLRPSHLRRSAQTRSRFPLMFFLRRGRPPWTGTSRPPRSLVFRCPAPQFQAHLEYFCFHNCLLRFRLERQLATPLGPERAHRPGTCCTPYPATTT